MVLNNFQLEGKVAIVTGCDTGLGQGMARALAQAGAHIVGVNVTDPFDTKAQIEALGRRFLDLRANLSDISCIEGLVAQAKTLTGCVDILVNNAGITRDQLIMMMPESDWDAVINTNLKSTFNCSKAAVKHMMRKRTGRIINMASVAGQMGNPGQTNYSASKGGQIAFTKALAREVAARNITVNAIAPGFVDTEILDAMTPEMLEAALKLVPLARKGKPEEIAFTAAFLASDGAAYITGQVVGVDGGMAMM